MIHSFQLATTGRDEIVDITRHVGELLLKHPVQDGFAIVYCPHTTAGIAVNENADPDVKRDLLRRLDEVYPWHHPRDRHGEGNTAAHLKAVTTGSSQTVLIADGKLVLGTWQGIYFCEFDGPRRRTVYVKLFRG